MRFVKSLSAMFVLIFMILAGELQAQFGGGTGGYQK
jgi:hypothetical protein